MKTKLTVTINKELNQFLDELADELGCTRGDIIRRGIVLMKLASEARMFGEFIGVADTPENLKREFILV